MSIRVAVYTCTECKLRSLRLRRETVRLVECRLFYTTRTLKKSAGQVENKDDVITNPANVQLLSPRLQAQVLGGYPKQSKKGAVDKNREKLAIQHLKEQKIWGKSSDAQPPINLQLPPLYGKDIEDHFIRLGIEQSGGYLEKAETFAKIQLPSMPKKWSQQSGWTRYTKDSADRVPHPLEKTVVFDVEVLVGTSQYPVMAVAASAEAWYSWTSPFVIGESSTPEHLIPLAKADKNETLVVGHNVGYDRARIADEYSRVLSGLRYLDTMSLHIAVSGLCSQQRPQWIKRRNQEEAAIESASGTPEDMEVKFFDVSSLNSLKDVVKFHCKRDMDKSTRNFFESGTLEDIQANFQDAMQYCAQDVAMTHAVYKAVFPKFRKNCPHPVSFAGMLHMGNSFLTVTEKWEQYLKRSSGKHEELSSMLDVKLRDLADKARELVTQPDVWQRDPWLSQLDWTVNPRQRKLKGQPKWYKDAYDSKTGALKISIRSRIAPLLLRLKWNGYPLHYMAGHAWCYKVPLDQLDKNLEPKVVERDDEYAYLKVPHKDGETANCGNPLAKNYISSFEDKVLTSEFEAARQALELNAQSAYWISSRERILGQFVVWDNNPTVNMQLPERRRSEEPHSKYGIILPQMVTMGTITRRAVEKTWLTASNAKANRIGSELKSMVQAPEGYKIVGADVDSEELWISSVIGDAQFGFHGATALGWMTLQGSKSEGTDLHSRTANILKISRDKAKVFNYARIYGAGVKYATSLLLQYSQGMDSETAKARALELYANTKGEKEHSVKNPFSRTFWHGGSESYMFNALEDIALSKEPRTPVLGCAITDALKPQYTGSQFLTSRVNWVVQSSGVDYLHLLIVAMAHLIERYNINARFMLSVHDEVRYLASEEDQHRTALALQVANLWTRALFSWRLGIKNLPQSVAFFSAVDIDHVLRKEPTMTCTTPSHQEKIDEGVSCTLDDTLKQLEVATQKKREETCLLGVEKETPGKGVDDEVIHKLQRDTQSPMRTYDLDFIKAQMSRDYRQSLGPSLRGSAETEERVSAKNNNNNDNKDKTTVQTIKVKKKAYLTSTKASSHSNSSFSSSSSSSSISSTTTFPPSPLSLPPSISPLPLKPSDPEERDFLTPEQVARLTKERRKKKNAKRIFSH